MNETTSISHFPENPEEHYLQGQSVQRSFSGCPQQGGNGPAGPAGPAVPADSTAQASYAAYQAAMPYPLIKPACKNPQYAAAMLDNMAGVNSEMSAVALYFYDHLITSAYREVAETFHHISIVEMHHLEIFGSLAMQLGENPRLWSRRNRGRQYLYWSPACMHYPPFPIPSPDRGDGSCGCPPVPSCPALKALLSQAIESEQEALNKYMKQSAWISDVNICDNLRRIAADEQMHIDILTRLRHKY